MNLYRALLWTTAAGLTALAAPAADTFVLHLSSMNAPAGTGRPRSDRASESPAGGIGRVALARLR
ncbi:MAG: hypothetical protein R6V58_13930 [Planctomycetota bacterium]